LIEGDEIFDFRLVVTSVWFFTALGRRSEAAVQRRSRRSNTHQAGDRLRPTTNAFFICVDEDHTTNRLLFEMSERLGKR
jgi:hypothetical protein